MASDTNLNRTGAAASAGESDLQGQASKTVKEIQNRSADALSKLTDAAQQTAQQVGRQAADQASSLASQANEQVSGLFKAQVGAGADIVDQVAGAARTIADNLDDKTPQLAQMIRSAAQSAEEFAQDARGRTLSEIVDMTSQFARRQPAIFMGAAVAGGFLLARFAKSSANTPSRGSSTSGASSGASPGSHGTRGDVDASTFHDA